MRSLGGLASGADIDPLMRSAANQTRKILAGASPDRIPVEQAPRFLFVVNRKAADVLGLEMRPGELMRADRVIE